MTQIAPSRSNGHGFRQPIGDILQFCPHCGIAAIESLHYPGIGTRSVLFLSVNRIASSTVTRGYL
jgi:hypothetical protein